VLSSVTGGDRMTRFLLTGFNLEICLVNKVMVGTVVNANRDTSMGVRDMSRRKRNNRAGCAAC